MIVKCDKCQTRFKIPDEKVTDKGVKVRCTKCQNTFRVTKAADAQASAPPAPVTRPAAPAPASGPAEFDPFASFGAPSGDAELTRPGFFAAGVAASRKDASAPPPPTADDLFDAPTRVGPLPIPELARGGGSAAKAVPPTPAAPPAPPPRVAKPAPSRPAPVAPPPGLDLDFPGTETSAPPPPAPPPRKNRASNLLADVPPASDPFGLDAVKSGPFGAPPAEGFSPPSGAFPAASADLSRSGIFGPSDATLGGNTGAHELPEMGDADSARAMFDMPERPPQREFIGPPADAPLELGGSAPPPATDTMVAKLALAPKVTKPAGKPEDARGLEDVPKQSLGRRVSGVVINLSIAAALIFVLLAVALNDGKLDLATFSPERLKSAFLPSREMVATDISNGLYETQSGRPVFFVRGEVVNRGEQTGKVRVRAEILDGTQLVRAAEGLAGATPTPEELYQIANQADLDAVTAKLDHAAKDVPAGGRAPFVVAFYEYPPELAGYRLRVTVQPAVPEHAAR